MDESPSNVQDNLLRKRLLTARDTLQFGKTISDFQKIIESLDKGRLEF